MEPPRASPASLLVAVAALACACRQPAPRPTAVAPEPSPAQPAPAPPPSATAPVVARDASATAGHGLALERVASSATGQLFAIGDGALYRFDGGAWARIALEGACARDLVGAHGVAWVLAKGTGDNAGHALVLRLNTGDDLRVVAAPELGGASEPRALAVIQGDEFWIGGEHPALAHVTGDRVETIALDAPVVALRAFHDEAVEALHPDHRATTIRWGEHAPLELDDDYLDAVADADGNAYTVHARGEVGRGRPGHEWAVVASSTPFAPRVVALLGEGRPAAVGAGGPYAVWEHHAWRTIPGEFPGEPIAIVPGDPVRVVGRDGEVVEVRGDHATAANAAHAPDA